MSAPLEGVLVVDLSRVLAGPAATALLADLGASVVKVERSGAGDDTRRWGPPWTETSSSYFESVNRSKRSIAVDLDDDGDLHLVRELLGRADVVVENFKVGGLARFGLDYASTAAGNPGVVYCSISGFGSAAGAAMPGYDFLVQAVGGLMSLTGRPDGEPLKAGVALVDVLASKDAAIGILAALAHRERTGHGQHVEVNLLSTLLAALVNQATAYLTTGVPGERLGNEHPSIAPYETLACEDAQLAVCCGNDEQFRRLCGAIGDPGLADEAAFRTNADRVANRTSMRTRLEAGLATDTARVWAERLTRVGVPAGEVGDVASAFDLAERLGLRPTVDVGPNHPAQVRHPVRYSAFDVVAPSAPPGLGEHSDEIRAWLGSSD